MKLSHYITKQKFTQKDFARILGISEPHLSQVINGKALPSIRLAILIERKTGGAVTLKDYSVNGKRAA